MKNTTILNMYKNVKHNFYNIDKKQRRIALYYLIKQHPLLDNKHHYVIVCPVYLTSIIYENNLI
jgi:hypothetical protein